MILSSQYKFVFNLSRITLNKLKNILQDEYKTTQKHKLGIATWISNNTQFIQTFSFNKFDYIISQIMKNKNIMSEHKHKNCHDIIKKKIKKSSSI